MIKYLLTIYSDDYVHMACNCSYDINEFIRKTQEQLNRNLPIHKINIQVLRGKKTKEGTGFPFKAKKLFSDNSGTILSEYSFYVTDAIKMDTQICAEMPADYDVPNPVGKPAVIERVNTIITPSNDGLIVEYKDPDYTINKKVDLHILDTEKDIVVNKNLHQIYPVKTGDYPAIIQKLMQKVRK